MFLYSRGGVTRGDAFVWEDTLADTMPLGLGFAELQAASTSDVLPSAFLVQETLVITTLSEVHTRTGIVEPFSHTVTSEYSGSSTYGDPVVATDHFTSFNHLDTSKDLIAVPTGLTLLDIVVSVSTPFDQVATLTVGISEDHSQFIASTVCDLSVVGSYHVTPNLVSAFPLYMRLYLSAGGSTTGEGVINVRYSTV